MISLSKIAIQVLLFILYTFSFCGTITGELVEMKIVDEPSSFGLNSMYNSQNRNQPEDNLKLRVQPANFSGPAHLRRLIGRCFISIIADYKYKFCPFSNVTQHEQGLHWNPYQGVLGVWQEWEIINNTYVAMVMRDGDHCGSIFRSVKVSFMCGNHSQIVNVSEPHTCSYHLVFMTPLVCHNESMLVYPSLSPKLQKEWDQLESDMGRGELTPKGYNKRLSKIFEEAGVYMSKEGREDLLKKTKKAEQNKLAEGEFITLESCKTEYKKLQKRFQALVSQAGTEGGTSDTEDHDGL
ncbi:N-acetylglucosamine-1-phosphotransferase subunit gamma-like [Physella acuta]|uniref:N-acetylglucosamine-1-phosphotransferase subunit gamma-like n=1 Tax=Physella acuta TaxID=109671 RepID=UPI0027DCF4C9|nr:N-acetylglucosamine-1-phosphotransferase subunit gamma-like [Physella acuta]